MKRNESDTPYGIVALLCLLLTGCDWKPFAPRPQEDWQTAPETHSCTHEQQRRVEVEAKWCSENTSYFATYCYGTAFMRNCTKKESADGK